MSLRLRSSVVLQTIKGLIPQAISVSGLSICIAAPLYALFSQEIISLSMLSMSLATALGLILTFYVTQKSIVIMMRRARPRISQTVFFSSVDNPESYQGFVQTITHDVQSPLLGIAHGLETLLLSEQDNQQTIELKRLHEQTSRLQSKLKNALELAKSAPGRRPDARPTDLWQLASDLAESYSKALSQRPQIMLSVLVDHRLPRLVGGEPRRILLMLKNIIDNAIRYTSAGRISVRLTAQSYDLAVGDTLFLEVSCSDCGCGIAPSRLATIARELHTYADMNPATETEVGLGLRTVAAVIAEHRGSLTISSPQGKGTAVSATLEFPVLAVKRPQIIPSQTVRIASLNEHTVQTINDAASFHRISITPTNTPTRESGVTTVLVEGSDLLRGRWGAVSLFHPREQFVIIIRSFQQRLRDSLIELGFSRFITLPCASTSLLQVLFQDTTDIHGTWGEKRPQRGSALVVDDSETNRLRVAQHLRERGFLVTEASDGAELIETIRGGHRYSIIITDLTMSYIDGDEAVKQVREYERSRGLHTPIIAISAHLEDGLSSDLLSLFEGVLTKPVALPELDVYLDQLSADRKDEKMTKLIDIEDLRGRTAGKVKLMIMVLDSFMTSARTQLLTLQPTLRESDSQLLLRTLHTVKGLLLEAGAAMSAEKVARYERDLHKGTPISDASLDEIKYLVLQVVEEAARIKDDLSCSQ